MTLNAGEDNEFRGTANYQGITQVHIGLEIDFLWKVLDNLSITGMASVGNWQYEGDTEADLFDDNQNYVGSTTLYLDGVKVGDAAQTTAALGANYTFFKNFNAGLNWRYASNLYAAIDVTDFDQEENDGSLELPSFNLVDARINYNWHLKGGNSLEFSVNVNNLFDTLYISEADTNIIAGDGDNTWEGVDTRNRVYFGWGRSWNTAIRFRF